MTNDKPKLPPFKTSCEHDMGDYWWDGPNPDAVYRKETPDEKCPICKPVEPSVEEIAERKRKIYMDLRVMLGRIIGEPRNTVSEASKHIEICNDIVNYVENEIAEALRNERNRHG